MKDKYEEIESKKKENIFTKFNKKSEKYEEKK